MKAEIKFVGLFLGIMFFSLPSSLSSQTHDFQVKISFQDERKKGVEGKLENVDDSFLLLRQKLEKEEINTKVMVPEINSISLINRTKFKRRRRIATAIGFLTGTIGGMIISEKYGNSGGGESLVSINAHGPITLTTMILGTVGGYYLGSIHFGTGTKIVMPINGKSKLSLKEQVKLSGFY